MQKRIQTFVVVASALACVSSARADLTVSFATDGPAPALSVSVVPSDAVPEPTPAPATPAIAPIEAHFVRVGDGSGETATLVLRDAAGEPADDALDRLSILARPRDVPFPGARDATAGEGFVAPGILRLHEGLLPLLTRLAARFPGHAIQIVSGYRPGAREGSRHRFGRALDLRIEGIAVDEVHAFLDGTVEGGLGLYPTSDFVHLDVRSERVRWTDDSGPGQPSHVVRTEVGTHSSSSSSETDAVEAAMRAADAITLDLRLP